MRIFIYLLLSLILFTNISFAEEITETITSDRILEIQQQSHSRAKLYAPNFVLIGNESTFKVLAMPNAKAKLILDYGSTIPKQTIEGITNDKGIATFNVIILDDKDLIGKSVAIDAYVLDANNSVLYDKAVLQNEKGHAATSNRIYITDKDAAKGVVVSPLQSLNNFIMSVDYSEKSDFNPVTDLKYDASTPVYIKNMRDAQENVREVPTNTNNSHR